MQTYTETKTLTVTGAPRAAIIASLNDAFRTGSQPPGHNKTVMTQGIAALPVPDIFAIINKVRLFNDFTNGNDPYAEHDFGRITHNEMSILFKIDYYALDMLHHSEDPTNPEQTIRVLTIMRASEY